MTKIHALYRRYPPSRPCTCQICRYFCMRPGWWLVSEARGAIDSGYAGKMMLEFSPDRSFGVLSPAFRGNGGNFALQEYSYNGCIFFENESCELFGSILQPVECRFCHHKRIGRGEKCHHDIAKDWNTGKGKRLVRDWVQYNGLSLPDGFIQS